ncbi:MAG: sigma-70 family RNA polymerase sigma factor [Rhodothermales bacterium]
MSELRYKDGRRAALKEMSDEELMRQLQSGVEEAFNILVERYKERLASYLYHFLHDEKQAEDLLQETFLRLFRNRYSYEPIAKFSTWLYTIAGNLARSEYRRRKRHRTTSLYANGDGEEYELPIPSEALAPDRYAERGIHSLSIQNALDQLGEDFREVVVLRDVQLLSYEEISEITGLPMGTVKSRINRGRTKLQEMLKDIYVREEG